MNITVAVKQCCLSGLDIPNIRQWKIIQGKVEERAQNKEKGILPLGKQNKTILCYAFNPNNQEAEAGKSLWAHSLFYIAYPRRVKTL